MKVYDTEKSRGLEKLIINSTKSSASNITLNKTEMAKAVRLYPKGEEEYLKKCLPEDLMQVNSILVSTDWNRNDDIFTSDETWKAKYSARFKPVNIEHNGQEGTNNSTLGVIISCYPVDAEYNPIDTWEYDNHENKKEPPAYFHLLNTALLWEQYFPTATNFVKKGIDEGKMFVSMEAFFDDFGYGLKAEGSNNTILMLRNQITSWLTSYLKAYNGSGEVIIDGTKYRIGRWLRDISFSGMGFVENPANPPSIIFEDYVSHASVKNIFKHISLEETNKFDISKEKVTKSNQNIDGGVLNTVMEKRISWLTS